MGTGTVEIACGVSPFEAKNLELEAWLAVLTRAGISVFADTALFEAKNLELGAWLAVGSRAGISVFSGTTPFEAKNLELGTGTGGLAENKLFESKNKDFGAGAFVVVARATGSLEDESWFIGDVELKKLAFSGLDTVGLLECSDAGL